MNDTSRTPVQIAKQPLRQVQDVGQLLDNAEARQRLASIAASHMNPERLMRITAGALRTTPKLKTCEPMSLLGALMQCAALGLEPNTVLGHAYLIPFENSRKVKGDDGRDKWVKVPEVQLIIGYKGLIDLARRSGHITSISANVHYSDDELWEYEEGTEAKLRHRPGPQDGEKLHAYAIAKFRDGGYAYVVLPWAQVLKIRNGSQNWQSAVKFNKKDRNPWTTHEDAMAKKTAIRALAKFLPLSVEFRDAVQIDHDAGARADFGAFAMDPSGGVTVEGEIAPENDQDEGGEDAASGGGEGAPAAESTPAKVEGPAEKKAAEKPAQRASGGKAKSEPKKQAKKEPEPEPEPEDENVVPEEYQGLVARIVGDLGELEEPGEVDGTLELFADQIDLLREHCPAAYEQIDAAAEAARERTSGGEG